MPHPSDPISIAGHFEVAAPIIAHNGWAPSVIIDALRPKALASQRTQGRDGLSPFSAWMVDHRALTPEHAGDLDTILSHQAYLPGYQLLGKLGSGGMGIVFLAMRRSDGQQVAIKTINARLSGDTDFINRFNREADALAGLDHPHVARILDRGEADGHCYMAMEFIDGPSLMSLLRDHGVLPEAYALVVVRQVADGLAHAWNTARLVHRDLKPENILVIRQRQPGTLFPLGDHAKLIDFGLVKSNRDDDRLTQTGMTIGTPLYMSPEQVRGEPLDCRSDIYGLGATLYHLLTGTTPFTGGSSGAIMSAHLTQPVPDPGSRVPSLHPGTRELVRMAMAKDPGQRFLTCEGLMAAIDPVLASLAPKAGDAPRLLRKPLVVKPGTLRKPAEPVAGTGGEPAPAGRSAPPSTVASDRKPAAEPAGTPRTSQRQAPVSDRKPVADTARSQRKPIAVTAPAATDPGDPPTSAAFVDDLHRPSGIGLTPWLVLGGAVAALGVYWLLIR